MARRDKKVGANEPAGAHHPNWLSLAIEPGLDLDDGFDRGLSQLSPHSISAHRQEATYSGISLLPEGH